MGILDFFIIIFFGLAVYAIKRYKRYQQYDVNDNKRQPMQTITEIRSHNWLMRMGMREHAENFNGFGLRRTVARRKGRSQWI